MYNEEKATIDALRLQFERQVAARQSEAYTTATRYMAALTAFVHTFNDGPGADAGELALDTTGTRKRTELDVAWAEAERRRVRATLDTIA